MPFSFIKESTSASVGCLLRGMYTHENVDCYQKYYLSEDLCKQGAYRTLRFEKYLRINQVMFTEEIFESR